MQIVYHSENSERRKELEDFQDLWNRNSNVITVKTSGSTGQPKLIELEKLYIHNSADATNNYFNLSPGSRYAHCLSMQTIAGIMMFVRAYVNNGILEVYDVSSNPLPNYFGGSDLIALVPIQLNEILKTNPNHLIDIKNIVVGGGSISSEIESKLKEQQITVYQSFGMTETISHIALRKVGQQSDENYEALPNCYFAINNGALIITAEHLGIHGLQTNDHAMLIDNQHFKWLGRLDFIINSGGIKLQPEELEKKIEKLASIRFFIFGENDPVLGQRVCLLIEGEQKEIDFNSVFNKLMKYEIPKRIYFIDHFEQTESGKIDRLKTIEKLKTQGIESIL